MRRRARRSARKLARATDAPEQGKRHIVLKHEHDVNEHAGEANHRRRQFAREEAGDGVVAADAAGHVAGVALGEEFDRQARTCQRNFAELPTASLVSSRVRWYSWSQVSTPPSSNTTTIAEQEKAEPIVAASHNDLIDEDGAEDGDRHPGNDQGEAGQDDVGQAQAGAGRRCRSDASTLDRRPPRRKSAPASGAGRRR